MAGSAPRICLEISVDLIRLAQRSPSVPTMASCPLCSSKLSFHISGNRLYWYCDRCRESFPPNFLLRYRSESMQSLKSSGYRRSLHKPIRRKTKPKSYGIECLYRNETSHPQIIKISNLPHGHWEKVVLPGQCQIFQTLSTAELEVISGPMTSMIADRIPCRGLSLRSLKSPPSPIVSQPASPQPHQSNASKG